MGNRLASFFAAFAFLFCAFASPASAQTVCNDPSGFLKTKGPITLGDVLILSPDCQSASDGGNIAGPPVRAITHPSSGNLYGGGCLSGEAHNLWWLDENMCSGADVWQITSSDPSAIFTATLSGSVTVGDTITFTVTMGSGLCSSPACTFSATAAAGDTLSTLAGKLVCALAANSSLFDLNGGSCSGGVITPATGLSYGGYAFGNPIGYTVIIGNGIAYDFNSNISMIVTASVSGSATETVTLGNTNCSVRCSYSLDNNPALQMVRVSGGAPQPGSVLNAIYSIGATSACPTSDCVNYGSFTNWVGNSTVGSIQSAWLLQTPNSNGTAANGFFFGQGIFANAGGSPFSSAAAKDMGGNSINFGLGGCEYWGYLNSGVLGDSICQNNGAGQFIIAANGADNIIISSSHGIGINTTPTGNAFVSNLGMFVAGAQTPTTGSGLSLTYGTAANLVSENYATTTYQQMNFAASLFAFAPNNIGANGAQLLSNEFYPATDNQFQLGDTITPHRFKTLATMGATFGGSSSGNTTLQAQAAASGTLTLPAATATLLSTAGGILSATTSNPTGTTSLTGVMMGLGSTCHITPSFSTRVKFEFYGQIINNTATDGALGQLSFGTGTAPANGAAATGTQFGNATLTGATASTGYPFSIGGVQTGLTPGTAYWFDLKLQALTGGTASVQNLTCVAYEM